jgi:N-methylhydantoinase B
MAIYSSGGESMPKLDYIFLEILKNRLQNIVEEAGEVMRRTAMSGTIVEIMDCTSALWDSKRRLIGQASHIPIHIISMKPMLERILELHPPKSLSQGDALITNDPYLGMGQHLPDIGIIMPIFWKGEIVGYSSTMAHHQDIGGMTPGGMPSKATEIYQEGLRIPPLKLMKKNDIDTTLMEMLLCNVRTPRTHFEGDLKAQIAGCNIICNRFSELLDKYGLEIINTYIEELLNYSERLTRNEISTFKKGNYEFDDYIDDDGFTDKPVKLHLKVTIEGTKVTFDYTGTDRQTRGPINCMVSATEAMSLYTFCCLLDPNIPKNAGCFRPLEVIVPKGTLLNPSEPAPVNNRNVTAHRIPDVVLGALSKVVPQKVIAACYGSTSVYAFFVRDDNDPMRVYQVTNVAPGGMGAGLFGDGESAICCHLSNTRAFEMESTEIECPFLLVSKYEISKDTGGPGSYRGGCGLEIHIGFSGNYGALNLKGGRHTIAPYGLFGGKGGGKGIYKIRRQSGKIERVPPNSNNELTKGEMLIYRTAGGGGYGNPLKRSPELVVKDIMEDFVSIESAREDYGVILNAKGEIQGFTDERNKISL